MSEVLALIFAAAVVIAFLFYLGWYQLQARQEEIRESSSALQLMLRTKLELTRQAMEACQERADREKLARLQVSGDMAGSFKDLAKANARAEYALAYVSHLAARFPELKADARFTQLSGQLENLGGQLDTRHEQYNAHVEEYNLARTRIPLVVVARTMRFPEASHLNLRDWMMLLQAKR
jgi:hypothetical protein